MLFVTCCYLLCFVLFICIKKKHKQTHNNKTHNKHKTIKANTHNKHNMKNNQCNLKHKFVFVVLVGVLICLNGLGEFRCQPFMRKCTIAECSVHLCPTSYLTYIWHFPLQGIGLLHYVLINRPAVLISTTAAEYLIEYV